MNPVEPVCRMAIDLGQKRIGLAIAGEQGLGPRPLMTLERAKSPRELLRQIARLGRKHGVEAYVVGLPLHLSGEESPRARKSREFAATLAELTGLPVELHDERLTSEEAHQRLYEAGRARQEHGAMVDQVAALLILESYLAERVAGDHRQG